MRKIFIHLQIGLILATLLLNQVTAQERTKIAQTGLQFLSVVSDARGAAIGDAVTGLEMKSSSLFFNPAGMANMTERIDLSISMNQWIADINYNAVSFAINPVKGKYGVFGATFLNVDYGEVIGTRWDDSDQGYIDTGDISPNAFAFGVGYSKALSDRFAVGGHVRWVKQELGSNVIDTLGTSVKNEVSPMSFDFGTLFKTGIKSLAFGMSVRNFSQEIKYEQEGFQLPLVFTMGVSANLVDFVNLGDMNQDVFISFDGTHFRSHPEQFKLGIDYRLMNILSLRGGYVYNNDVDDFTFGFGVSQFGFQIDYAYTPFDGFENVQRFTARFSF